ncbi:MAG: hypothetical protein JWP40_977 [Blastococcus sp.]|nr:hypothetical protein [Blastococcus sp.]
MPTDPVAHRLAATFALRQHLDDGPGLLAVYEDVVELGLMDQFVMALSALTVEYGRRAYSDLTMRLEHHILHLQGVDPPKGPPA